MHDEDLDLPNVDTVMMLRPTESQIMWLQQFGRGLRFQENKRLKVIDYIGNHRSFLIKPRALFQLGPGDREVAYALDRLEAGTMELPPGCSVTYELEVKDILRSLIRIPQRGEALQAYYQDFLERNGIRPTAVEAFNDGYDPKALRRAYGSWFGFVDAMDGLSAEERAAFQALRSFLAALDATPMIKSFKVLTRAGRPFPAEPIRTLDAIHLATADFLGDPPPLVTIVTRDARVRENARALGYAIA